MSRPIFGMVRFGKEKRDALLLQESAHFAKRSRSLESSRRGLLVIPLFAVSVALSVLPVLNEAGAVPVTVLLVIVWVAFAVILSRDHWLRDHPRAKTDLVLLFALHLVFVMSFGVYWRSWLSAEGIYTGIIGIDPFRQDSWGWEVAQALRGGDLSQLSLPFEQIGIIYLQGVIYALLGRNLFFMGVLNGLFGGLIVLETYRLGRLVLSERGARLAMLLVAVLPENLSSGTVGYKDPIVAYLLLVVLRWLVTSGLKINLKRAAGLGVSIFLLAELRTSILPTVMFFGLLVVLEQRRSFKMGVERKMFLLLAVGGLLLGGIAVAQSPGAQGALSELVSPKQDLTLRMLRNPTFEFATTAAESLAIRTFWNYDLRRAYLIPIRAIFQFLIPFPPLHFANPREAANSVSQWVVLALGPLVAWSSWQVIRQRKRQRRLFFLVLLPLIFQAVGLAVALPMFAQRYRLSLMPFFMLLAAYGIEHFEESKIVYVFAPVVMVLGSIAYYLLKG